MCKYTVLQCVIVLVSVFGKEAYIGGVDKAETDGFRHSCCTFVHYIEAYGEVFLPLLDHLVGLAETVAYFAGSASGGLEEKESAFGIV